MQYMLVLYTYYIHKVFSSAIKVYKYIYDLVCFANILERFRHENQCKSTFYSRKRRQNMKWFLGVRWLSVVRGERIIISLLITALQTKKNNGEPRGSMAATINNKRITIMTALSLYFLIKTPARGRLLHQ